MGTGPRRDAALIARTGTTEQHAMLALNQVIPLMFAGILVLWMAIVAGRGAVLTLQTFGVAVAGEGQPNYATPRMIAAAAFVLVACLLAALLVRRVRPAATLPVTHAVGSVAVLSGAVVTGAAGSLIVALLMWLVIWLVGAAILHRLPALPETPVVRFPVAVGLGIIPVGLLLFALASVGALNAVTVTAGAMVAVLVVIAVDRQRLARAAKPLPTWTPATPTWFETVLTGMAVGLLAFALLAAFVPENQSDAIRQHLPIAREIWQTGSAPEFPPIGSSRYPVQAHLFFAVGYGFGGMTAAKLVQTFAGLAAIAGVAGLGWLVAGRTAALVSATIVATMPLVLWELGHAYLDLFPVFFSVAAALCVLLWQRDGALLWLVGAGALAGFGFATKLSMAWMMVALAVAIFVTGRAPWRWRDRILAVAVFALGTVVVIPWIMRTIAITGTLPVFDILFDQLAAIFPSLQESIDQFQRALPASGAAIAPPGVAAPVNEQFGRAPFDYSRSPLDLLRIPWELTFHGEIYHSEGAGDIGIAFLMLLPFALFAARTRAVAALAMTAIVSYVGWWLSPQITRHLLPTLAIAAALAGSGVASIAAAAPSRTRQSLATATQAGIIVSLLAAPLLFLPNWKATLPVDLFIGQQSAPEYVAETIPAAAVLAAATAGLPPDTPVGYVGQWEGAQLYTEARLTNLKAAPLGATPAEVLASFDQLGVDYFIWDRPATTPEDWQSTLLSGDFLGAHMRILAGDRDSYLFAILPGGETLWGEQDPRDLLRDPSLERVGENGPWTTTGKVKARKGVASIPAKSAIAQEVAVSGGTPYLLSATGRCDEAADRVELAFRWYDGDGVELETARERVYPGQAPGVQLLWRRAPAQAATVLAELAAAGAARCEFDELSLYQLS